MRVVYLNPSGQLGGAEASLLTLITSLSRDYRDFEPHVITTSPGALVDNCIRLGIGVEILELPAELEQLGDAGARHEPRQTLRRLVSLIRCGLETTYYAKRLARAVDRLRPDLIHTNGLKMHLLGAWIRGKQGGRPVPLVGHIHDYVSTRPLAGKLLRMAAGRYTCFVANSESVARDVEASLRTKRVWAIYNAVDTDRFSPYGDRMDLDQACGMPPAEAGTIRIGLAATFARWKGHVTLLRAVAKIGCRHPIRAFIIGGPIYRTAGSQFSLHELRETASRLGLQEKVGFTGFIEDTSKAIRSLDIVVHASTAPEPFGLAIVEAMACAKPTIVSNAGGAAELFEEGVTGLGHRPGDEDDLAAQIERLVTDSHLRTLLGERARRSVIQRFQTREMAAQFCEVYNSAIVVSRLQMCESVAK